LSVQYRVGVAGGKEGRERLWIESQKGAKEDGVELKEGTDIQVALDDGREICGYFLLEPGRS
jgi:hypothetical protein